MTDFEDAPTITLGGQQYRVPAVAFREVSKILPLVTKVFAGIQVNDLSEPVLDGLGKVIFYGVKRAAGDLSYEAFIDRPATVEEMITAAMVVCAQAGLQRKDPAPGEATGASPPDFEELTASVVMATGWAWEYVWENMTLQRLEVMGRLWKKAPPEHISAAKIYALFAARLGVKEESPSLPVGPTKLPDFATLPDIEE